MGDRFDLHGRTAAIVGGCRGFGRAIALALAEHGADIVIADADADGLAALAADVGATGRRCWPVALDIGRWQALDEFVEGAHAEVGTIGILVCASDFAAPTPRSIDMDEAVFDATVAANLKGPFRLAALFGDRMRAAGGGSIVLIGSASAVHPAPALAVHAAAKGALGAVVRAHALEFGPAVRVNAIMPGDFDGHPALLDVSADNAARRSGRAKEIATTAIYLASAHSSFTTGTVIALDGGQI